MKNFLISTIKYFIVFFITLYFTLNVASLTQVLGDSMEPNLDGGTVLLLNKIHYKIFDVERNDIVAFTSSTDHNLIKRVIGLPGETIEYINNTLIINGVLHEEDLSLPETPNFSLEEIGYDVIPENMYLVLGDNRLNSYDSREFGLVSRDEIIGKCSFTIWPLLN